ncbi:Fic family protein [Frigoribacterium sp. PhB24]|uniref:Fic family protein n=1 Tax=Frigoribacterium sp. PhB24 TaxID=2485204 RepID=UPI000F4699DB|nr:Fic family protein [Frigoribacterium sp. PhB24]ROS54724.1 Fic/DOC family protein [Frigoribacterium sp. PhB24]
MTDAAEPTRASSSEAVYTPFPSFATWMRSFSMDERLFATFATRLSTAKDGADPESLREAIETATKWAAIDTGAIEGLYEVDRGFTFSVAATAAAWDNIHLAKNEQTERAIKDALEAYDFVLDAATRRTPISEMLIKTIHEIICRSQDEHSVVTAVGLQKQEMPKGEYKKHANSPFNIATETVHAYASVLDTPPEMARLIAELSSDEFASAHPVAQASYAHYAFVCIHPFADGNGRVSRALASIYLYRQPGVPLVIFADQKNLYIDALEAADVGQFGQFQQFIADATIDTIQSVVEQFRSSKANSEQDVQARLRDALVGPGGLPHDEVDSLARRLLAEFAAALEDACTAANLQAPLEVTVQSNVHYDPTALPEGYRPLGNRSSLILTVTSAEPAGARLEHYFAASVARPTTTGADLAIHDGSGMLVAEAFVRDLAPRLSSSLAYRLELTAARLVGELVSRTASAAADTLRQNGYL